MTILNNFGRILTFQDRKLNGFVLFMLIFLSGFIGIYGIIVPSLLNGSLNDDSALNRGSGSNSGYEEMIRVNIDKYGNLSVTGSFQGPQVTPAVNWALPEYDSIWNVLLTVINPKNTAYYHRYIVQTLDPRISMNDVYLLFMFPVEGSMVVVQNPAIPLLTTPEMQTTSATLKNDIENAFGILNNLSANPIAIAEYYGIGRVFIYGFNYTAQVDYDYFIQYFKGHLPSGLGNSFSAERINDTESWITWTYSNCWTFSGTIQSSLRSPEGDYDSYFDCQITLQYPRYFGSSYTFGDYTLNLNTVLDVPIDPLVVLNRSAFSSSEIDIIVENGEITSNSSSSYHIPQNSGLDDDYWLLLISELYGSYWEGSGRLSDIQVNFTFGLLQMTVLSPPPTPQKGDIPVNIVVSTTLSNPSGRLEAQVYDEATFYRRIFDDNAYTSFFSPSALTSFILTDPFMIGNYMGMWEDTYGYPNGNYYIYFYSSFPEMSLLTPRTKYSGTMGGHLYGYTFVQLNNPNQIHIDVDSPRPHEALTKSVPVVANISSPNPILRVEYLVYNYSSYIFQGAYGPYMMGGNLTLTGGSMLNGTWSAILDTTQLPSTNEYLLRLRVIDLNGTFFEDIPILVNNTFYQENIPIYAPMGAIQQDGYDLYLGAEMMPQLFDPYYGGGGGGGPTQHMFYGFGVDFGMDFNTQLYKDVIYVVITADNPSTRNPIFDLIKYGLSESDVAVMILAQGVSPQTITTILEKTKSAFNIPTLTLVSIEEVTMGPALPVSVLIYGYNYSVINYQNFITKFHNSVPSGLANIYTVENMTQVDVESSILFGWANPDFAQIPLEFQNYNCGKNAFISPVIQFPNYFNSTIGTQWTVSLHDLLPQISNFKACAPTTASAILSGFGPNIFEYYGMVFGAITLNSNITNWYPQDPLGINVTPLYDFPNPNFLNVIRFTMLDTLSAPYGLRIIDDLRFQFTGPYLSNAILSPTKDQSIALEDTDVTITSQSLNKTWSLVEYRINTLDGRSTLDSGTPIFNGDNWTDVIHSLDIMPGHYSLITYCRDTLGNWALNSTLIYINNSASSVSLDILINELGDIEIGYGLTGYPSFGYGMNLGIDTTLYNLTELAGIVVHFSEENTPYYLCTSSTGANWNVFVAVGGRSTTTLDNLQTISEPLIADLERVFNITGMLQQQQQLKRSDIFGSSPVLVWTMNYTAQRDYNYFLDHYETVRQGNLSEVVSKENLLKANQSYIQYTIYPDYYLRMMMTFFGFPLNSNAGDGVSVGAWMRFVKAYDYSSLNKPFQFSLAQLLGIQQLNTNLERGLTFSQANINTYVASGTNTGVYPNITPYTTHPIPAGNLDRYSFQMLNKSGPILRGINETDDIRFNFTAPYTIIQVGSPLPGATVHGDVSLQIIPIVEEYPISRAEATIHPISAYSDIPMNKDPITTVPLQLEPDGKTWSGTWESLDVDIPNGWYDIIFMVEDNLGRPQYTCRSVYLYNTYYAETLNVVVEQNGNTSVSFQMYGNRVNNGLDFSIPEYQETALTSFVAFNAYSGHVNLSKDLFVNWFKSSMNFDFGASIMVSPEISDADALLIATTLKDDYERAFGIEGRLSYIGTGVITIPMGPQPITLKFVAFGNNYTPTLTYEYFINKFHSQVPSGLNNSLPAATLTGTDSYLEWVNFMDENLANMGNPPSMPETPCMIMGKLFYPQYFGEEFMGDELRAHTLSLTALLNIPQFVHASDNVADSMRSDVQVLVENANITQWFPNIPNVAFLDSYSKNRYYATSAQRSYYQSWDDRFGNPIYSFPNWADINVTFGEPVTRPLFLYPSPGSIIDGLTNVSVLVQNNTLVTISDVQLKIYSEADYADLDIYQIIGPGATMPQARPSKIYSFHMNYVGGGIWNYTLPAYVLPDGPIWLEVVVATTDGRYSYNSSRVFISNSDPLAINVISPANGALVSGPVEISAQIINSTPINSVMYAIFDESLSKGFAQGSLESQGGSIYSGTLYTHALPNGTYKILVMVDDIAWNSAVNYSTMIQVSTPQRFEVQLIYPVSTMDRSPSASITAVATGPYPVISMEYYIYEVYYDSRNRQWQNTGMTKASGIMEDPNSVWVAYFDSSLWEDRVQSYGTFYDAYYEIEIISVDLTGAVCEFVDRFPLEPAVAPLAEITSPMDYDYRSGIFTVTVNVINVFDSFKNVYGEIRRTDGKVMDDLTFIVNPTIATAACYSYVLPDGMYTIAVWGTTFAGSFYDTVTVMVQNPTGFSVQCQNPSQWERTKENLTVQLAIENYAPTTSINAEIMLEWSYASISIPAFFYNITSGFWEAQWDTSMVPDGNYRIECRVRDINNMEVNTVRHFIIDNPPSVTIMSPIMGSNYTEYEPIYIDVFIPNPDVRNVELWVNGTYIMDLVRSGGANWAAVWSYTIGWAGFNILQIRAYDLMGNVNDAQTTWVVISPYTPPANQADLYEVKTLDFKGEEKTMFTSGETVEYSSTIRGDVGSNTYVVTAQTDDPLLQGFLQYNESVTVIAGVDIEVFFSHVIAPGAPIGIYTVQVIVWTDWPWNGGICVDFITITFEVR